MKHQVVMDVTELEEIKSSAFESGKKKGFAECLAQLERVLENPGTRLKGVAPDALHEKFLNIADTIRANQESSRSVPQQPAPRVVVRRRNAYVEESA